MNLSWPPADFDIEAEKQRLAEGLTRAGWGAAIWRG